jgi:ribosomal protein S18 acetylase RimI-like enzyme
MRVFYANPENYRDELKRLLELSDNDFVPSLSSRSSGVRETEFDSSCDSIEHYLSEVMEQELFLSCDNGSVVGFVSLNSSIPCEYFSDVRDSSRYITTIIVDPSFRGEGVGKSLVSEVQEYARNEGWEGLYTRTWSTNEVSISLFKSCGFSIDTVVDNDRSNGIDSVYMCYILGDYYEE